MALDGSYYLDVGIYLDVAGTLAGPAIPESVRDAALQDATLEVLDTITASWPVDTGLSLAGFETTGGAEGHDTAIRNPVDYTGFVHEGLVERLAAEGLTRARSVYARQLAAYTAKQAKPTGQSRTPTPFSAQAKRPPPGAAATADALARAGMPADVVEAMRAGDTAAAVRAFTKPKG